MMRSKSFETQDVKDRSERSRRVERLSILSMGITEDVFQVEGKIENGKRKFMPERGRCFGTG